MGIIIGHIYREKKTGTKYVFIGNTERTFTLAGDGYTIRNTLKAGVDFRHYFMKNYEYLGSALK